MNCTNGNGRKESITGNEQRKRKSQNNHKVNDTENWQRKCVSANGQRNSNARNGRPTSDTGSAGNYSRSRSSQMMGSITEGTEGIGPCSNTNSLNSNNGPTRESAEKNNNFNDKSSIAEKLGLTGFWSMEDSKSCKPQWKCWTTKKCKNYIIKTNKKPKVSCPPLEEPFDEQDFMNDSVSGNMLEMSDTGNGQRNSVSTNGDRLSDPKTGPCNSYEGSGERNSRSRSNQMMESSTGSGTNGIYSCSNQSGLDPNELPQESSEKRDSFYDRPTSCSPGKDGLSGFWSMENPMSFCKPSWKSVTKKPKKCTIKWNKRSEDAFPPALDESFGEQTYVVNNCVTGNNSLVMDTGNGQRNSATGNNQSRSSTGNGHSYRMSEPANSQRKSDAGKEQCNGRSRSAQMNGSISAGSNGIWSCSPTSGISGQRMSDTGNGQRKSNAGNERCNNGSRNGQVKGSTEWNSAGSKGICSCSASGIDQKMFDSRNGQRKSDAGNGRCNNGSRNGQEMGSVNVGSNSVRACCNTSTSNFNNVPPRNSSMKSISAFDKPCSAENISSGRSEFSSMGNSKSNSKPQWKCCTTKSGKKRISKVKQKPEETDEDICPLCPPPPVESFRQQIDIMSECLKGKLEKAKRDKENACSVQTPQVQVVPCPCCKCHQEEPMIEQPPRPEESEKSNSCMQLVRKAVPQEIVQPRFENDFMAIEDVDCPEPSVEEEGICIDWDKFICGFPEEPEEICLEEAEECDEEVECVEEEGGEEEEEVEEEEEEDFCLDDPCYLLWKYPERVCPGCNTAGVIPFEKIPEEPEEVDDSEFFSCAVNRDGFIEDDIFTCNF